MIRNSIEAWIFAPRERQILLLQVEEDGLSFWQPITGGIEKGERAAAACQREILEETGLEMARSELQPLGHYTVEIDKNLSIHKSLFLARPQKKDILISDEHTDFQWIDLAQVPSQLYWPSNQETFQMMMEKNEKRRF
ncbi:NUDIX hydrolase [Streptococcus panodentis]|uniref:NUDIX pyrophosphatase n=1 Tax=Streptococcus panodentis TaxID=1581472 RepID=A0ABS5AZH2_9STRE|nr:NUDIX domain-containing protein [Streptococcus panodentis]MBP2621983.1 NUDIX pyrophosphatase [Streptococcus panodentis]